MEETRQFFSALFAAAPDDLHGHLWTLRGNEKKSHWFKVGDGAEAVADLAVELGSQTNVYTGVSAAAVPGKAHDRIPAAKSAGIFGLWADLDIQNPDVHKKMNYPPSVEAVQEILGATGVPPSMLVHSGNGLQAWWLFDEFLTFDNDSERANVAALAHRWHRTLSARAAAKDWIFDSVYDLARVLRVPGTFNYKTEPPKPTTLIEVSNRRYSLDDFEPFILSTEEIRQSAPPASEHNYVVGELHFNPLAQVDEAMLSSFRTNDATFAQTFERRRDDLMDTSASSYDLSMANQCIDAGWSDQQIVNLLISTRRKYGDDVKRLDYYRRTLAKAHDRLATGAAWAGIEDGVADLREAKQSGDEEAEQDARRRMLETVSNIFGIRLTHATRYTATEPMFAIKVEGRFDIELGTMGDMTYDRVANTLLASDVMRDLPVMSKDDWRKAIVALREACVDQELGEEATEEGAMKGWLRDWVALKRPIDDVKAALESQYPFVNEVGDVHIFTKPFGDWLVGSQGQRTNLTQINRVLTLVGCERDERKITINGGRRNRTYWKVPHDVLNVG